MGLCGARDTSTHTFSFFGYVASVVPNRTRCWPTDMPPTFLEKGARDQYQALLAKYDTWLFDCDGVLWNGDQLVDGAKEVLEMLRRQSAAAILSGAVTFAC